MALNVRLPWSANKPAPSASAPPEPARSGDATDEADLRVTKLLRAASAHAKDPELTEKATGEYREAVTASGFDADVLMQYGRFLVSRGRRAAAEEILAMTLASDGTRVDAVELYLDLVHDLKLPNKRAAWAIKRLRTEIHQAPGRYEEALFYLIAHQCTEAIAAIADGPAGPALAMVQINRLYDEEAVSPELLRRLAAENRLTDEKLIRCHIRVALARGNRSVASELLESAPDEAVPVRTLRRAIRRARALGRKPQVLTYLDAYDRVRPKDSWARHLRAEMTTSEKAEAGASSPSNYQLGKTGFPFPPARTSPAYDVDPKRVFYLLHNSLPHHSAGYATRTHGLLTELNKLGWDVDGVTRLGYPYDMPGREDMPDVDPHEIVGCVDYYRLLTGRQIEKKNPLFDYTERYTHELLRLAKEERPAIIHAASNHWNGLTAVKTARQLGLPSIYEVRGLWEVTRGSRNAEWAKSNMYKYIARMEADAAKSATTVFAITKALKNELVDRGVEADKITLVPNGVDTTRFTPIARDQQLAAELGVTGKTVIGYVGSVLDYEGIELMLEAARQMARTREDFHVLIVGDGAELERFQDFVADNGLEHVITFTGRVPHEEVERYYSLIDITPFPRLPLPVCEMVSPLKPFEAMAMGKAVVASDVAALAEIVTPELNGLLHAKGSMESLLEQLTRLLDDPELRQRLGAQSRDWVVAERDWSRLAVTIADAYRDLVG